MMRRATVEGEDPEIIKVPHFRANRPCFGLVWLGGVYSNRNPRAPFPKGPKIEKIQDCPPGLKISSEIENFKRAARQTPIFVGNSEGQD